MRVWQMDPRVAVNDGGDCLFVQVLAKSVRYGWWWTIPSLSAPFGLDLVDLGVACTLDFLFFKFFGLFTSEPGLIVNIYWLTSIVLSALTAAFSFNRMGVDRSVSVVVAVLFALAPWTFWRNTNHVLLPLYLIPLTVLFVFCIFPSSPRPSKALRRALIVALFATGFLHAYIPFFTAALLLVVVVFRALANWKDASVKFAAIGLAALVFGTTLNLAPTVIYRATHGSIPSQKSPEDSEVYGLKIRTLITPLTSHPVPLFKSAAERVFNTRFPNENENRSAQLGTTGSLGFLLVLGYGLLLLIRPAAADPRPELNPLVFVVVTMLLVGTVGGFGTLFSVFVSSEIRAYNRVSVYILFASLAAIGLWITASAARWRSRGGWRNVLFNGCLIVWLVSGVADQAAPQYVVAGYDSDRRAFHEMRDFVRSVESQLPSGAAVFQLPHTEFIHDAPPGRMKAYDHARGYLHSERLRFSWGALTGRHGDWARETATLPVSAMLARIRLSGFSGIWLDTAGYPGTATRLIAELQRQVRAVPIRSASGRFLFFGFPSERLGNADSANLATNAELRELAMHPIEVTWRDGFYGEERDDGGRRWHWSRGSGLLELRNTLSRARTVTFTATLQSFEQSPRPLRVFCQGRTETFHVSVQENLLLVQLELQANSSTELRFEYDAEPRTVPGDPRVFGFMMINTLVDEALASHINTQ
jgi:phosphoglycerol transferase